MRRARRRGGCTFDQPVQCTCRAWTQRNHLQRHQQRLAPARRLHPRTWSYVPPWAYAAGHPHRTALHCVWTHRSAPVRDETGARVPPPPQRTTPTRRDCQPATSSSVTGRSPQSGHRCPTAPNVSSRAATTSRCSSSQIRRHMTQPASVAGPGFPRHPHMHPGA